MNTIGVEPDNKHYMNDFNIINMGLIKSEAGWGESTGRNKTKAITRLHYRR